MKIAVIGIMFCLAILSSSSYGEDGKRQETPEHLSAIESLSPQLRALLTQEMQAIQKGMMDIIPAYVSANWGEIESIAVKMKNSYILQQGLTEGQVRELHNSLPESFIRMDERFHYLSGMLKHAAQNKKAELVGFYFSRLSESCVNCHSQFAVHKFPAFAAEDKTHRHNH